MIIHKSIVCGTREFDNEFSKAQNEVLERIEALNKSREYGHYYLDDDKTDIKHFTNSHYIKFVCGFMGSGGD